MNHTNSTVCQIFLLHNDGSSFESIEKINFINSYVNLQEFSLFFFETESFHIDDQLTCSSSILSSSPRTPGKKVIKGDPIITGIRLRPFLERFDLHLTYSFKNQIH